MQRLLVICWLCWIDSGCAAEEGGLGSLDCEEAEAEADCNIPVAEESVAALKKLYGCVAKLKCMKERALEAGKASWEANNNAVGEYAKLTNNIAELAQNEPFDIAFAVDQKLRYDELKHHLQDVEETLPHWVSSSEQLPNQFPKSRDQLESGENEALQSELKLLKLSELQKRAREAGAEEEEVTERVDAEDPKAALIDLILSKKAVGSLVQILAGAWKDKTGVIEEYRASRLYPYKVGFGEGESRESRWFSKHEMKLQAKDTKVEEME